MKSFTGMIVLGLLLVAASITPAFPWGDAPTHPSMGVPLVQLGIEPLQKLGEKSAQFVRATACPDIVNTQLFKSSGFGYVHTQEFADYLVNLALAGSNQAYQATALAWAAHLAADKVAHEEYIPPLQEPLHSLVEVAVDTVIYYNGFDPLSAGLASLGFYRWEDTVLRGNDCSPALVALASSRYANDHTGTPVISWFAVWWATQSLAASINAEYGYIRLKQNADASELFLRSVDKEDFLKYWIESVGDACAQINGSPCSEWPPK